MNLHDAFHQCEPEPVPALVNRPAPGGSRYCDSPFHRAIFLADDPDIHLQRTRMPVNHSSRSREDGGAPSPPVAVAGGPRPSPFAVAAKAAMAVGAVAFGAFLLGRTSAERHLFDRYSLRYTVLLAAYAPVVIGALAVAVSRRGLLATLRAVCSLRLFQIHAALLAGLLTVVAIRYVRHGSGVDEVRITGVVFLIVGFTLCSLAWASHRGVPALRGVLVNLTVSFLAFAMLGGVVSGAMWLSAGGSRDVVTRADLVTTEILRGPNASFVHHGQPGRVREFRIPIVNNVFGYNDRARAIANPADRVRIVIIGDSYVEAAQVPRGSSFAAVLEDSLNARRDRFEVIPLGRGGFGQVEQRDVLVSLGLRFTPDVVVLLAVPNDIYDDDPALAEAYRRYARIWSPSPPVPRALLFPGFAPDRAVTFVLHGFVRRYAHLLDRRIGLATVQPDAWALIQPPPPPITRAMATTERLITDLAERTRARGAEFVLLLNPDLYTVSGVRRAWPALRRFETDPQAWERWLERYAASREIPVLNLRERFATHVAAGGEAYRWKHDGHWNALGHRLVADAVLEFLSDNGFLPTNRTGQP